MPKKLKQMILKHKVVSRRLATREQHYSHLLEQSRYSEKHFRRLARQILLTQEKERKQISRELHDGIAQTLAGINLYLETLKVKTAVSGNGSTKKITLAQSLVEKSLKIVLGFARDLRPTLLDDLGLFPALQAHMKSFTKRTGILIRFKTFQGEEKLNSVKRTVLYRVAQATLENVARHAQASLVKIKIQKITRFIQMEIKDNGKSFRVKNLSPVTKSNRLSLHGMREYVEMVGGRFTVKSIMGIGTTVKVEVPFL